MKKKNPKSNRKIVEKGKIAAPMYMITHFTGLIQGHNKWQAVWTKTRKG